MVWNGLTILDNDLVQNGLTELNPIVGVIICNQLSRRFRGEKILVDIFRVVINDRSVEIKDVKNSLWCFPCLEVEQSITSLKARTLGPGGERKRNSFQQALNFL